MKRLNLFIICLLAFVAGAWANPIGLQKAERLAYQTYMAIGGNPSDAVFAECAAEAGLSHLYLFVANNGKGFVLVSADDCVKPVLAYSSESSFPLPMPDGVRQWVEDYDNAMGAVLSNAPQNAKYSKAGVDAEPLFADYSAVGPLVQTKWNQSPYYNDSCPISSGYHCLAGCVPTAMAQIMRYWKSPVTGVGQHSYTPPSLPEQSADFANTTYDWDNMPVSLNSSSLEAEIRSVAQLIYHCGVSVNTGYGLSGSSASPYDAMNALYNYFGYVSTMSFLWRSAYTDSEWISLLKADVNAGRPVLYSGSDTVNGNGHGFIIDGYDSQNHFHINWGWGGAYDGYFAMDGFNPQGSGAGGNSSSSFNAAASAVIGIEPTASSLLVLLDETEFDAWGDTIACWIRSANQIQENWMLTSDDNWIVSDVISGEGSGALTYIKLIASENRTGAARNAHLTFVQGTERVSYTFSQSDIGTPTAAGCFGNQENATSMYLWPGGQLKIVRPESYGNFRTGQRLTSVSFTTSDYPSYGYIARNFVISIYENCNYHPYFDLYGGCSATPDFLLGTEAYRQTYTATSDGTHDVTLTTPYQITSGRTFWIVLSTATSDTTYIQVTRQNESEVDTNDYPVMSQLATNFIETWGTTSFVIPYGYQYTSGPTLTQYNRQLKLSFCIEGEELETVRHSVTFADSEPYGMLTGAGTFDANSSVTIAALPNSGYRFVRWSDGVESNPRNFVITSDTSFSAEWDVQVEACANVFDTAYVTACDSSQWHGQTYTATGMHDYVSHGSVEGGCDSIYILDLTINHSVSTQRVETACDTVLPVVWHDMELSQPDIYQWTGNAANGCDSLVFMRLEVMHCTDACSNVFDTTSITACDSYTWEGTMYTTSGMYNYVSPGAVDEECDSIYILDLTINNSVQWRYVETVCDTMLPIEWHGMALTVTDDYDWTGTAANNCDSVVYMHLEVIRCIDACTNLYDTSYVDACNSYLWHGQTYSASGTHDYVSRGAVEGGCDSIYILDLTINHTVQWQYVETVCDTVLPIEWNGMELSGPDNYQWTGTAANGCDSAVYMRLEVEHCIPACLTVIDTTSVEACGSYVWRGNTYMASGVFADTLENAVGEGCDSIYMIEITFGDTYVVDTVANGCDSMMWHGQTYRLGGIYTHDVSVGRGECDTVLRLTLSIFNSEFVDTNASVCDSIRWGDSLLTVNNSTIFIMFTTSHGCDSLMEIHLTVRNSSPQTHEYAEACGYYLWRGYRVEHDGEFGDTLVNAVGCDSVILLHLTLNPMNEGMLSGVFEIADNGTRISFSKGNLQYLPAGDTWQFAFHQYDVVGGGNANATADYGGWIDLFGWGTSGYHNEMDADNVFYEPYSTDFRNVSAYNTQGYGPSTNRTDADLAGLSSNYDWGIFCAISNGGSAAGHWRTLTNDEWDYLLFYRPAAVSKRGMAMVNGNAGLILLPEWWLQPEGVAFTSGNGRGYYTNVYDATEWTAMESAGAVFLPAAGMRHGTTVSVVGQNGYYWASDHYDATDAYVMLIEETRVSNDALNRSVGRSVRLVQPLDEGNALCATYGDTCVTAVDSYTWYDETFTRSGDYSHLLPSANAEGCDSTVVLHLNIRSSVGIDNVPQAQIKAWADARKVLVSGADGLSLRIYDVTGRVVASDECVPSSPAAYIMPAAGVYMIKVGDYNAKKVVITE